MARSQGKEELCNPPIACNLWKWKRNSHISNPIKSWKINTERRRTLADDFYVVPGSGLVVADNGALLLNALDALAGRGELSRLRSRAASLRPMDRIETMREAAEAQYFRQQSTLEARLATTQARLAELQSVASGEGFFAGDPEAELTPDERAELSALREDILTIRAGLRDIERDYRREIDALEATLKAINIWGGPLLVMLAGLLVWRRQAKRRRAAA